MKARRGRESGQEDLRVVVSQAHTCVHQGRVALDVGSFNVHLLSENQLSHSSQTSTLNDRDQRGGLGHLVHRFVQIQRAVAPQGSRLQERLTYFCVFDRGGSDCSFDICPSLQESARIDETEQSEYQRKNDFIATDETKKLWRKREKYRN